ncbi:MAG TPA: glycosyl hydrolase family 18 protein [Clostridia bacterium]|nr:glycosyl hydrolase family 18 protein [Clostridia bacterium]
MRVFLIGIIVILLVVSSVLGFMYIDQSESYNEIYEILKSKRTTSNLIVNDVYIYDYEINTDAGVYIPFELVLDQIDPTLELSNSGARVYVLLSQLDFSLETEVLDKFVNENLDRINIPLRIIDGKRYLNLELLEKIYPLHYNYYSDSESLYLKTNTRSVDYYETNQNQKVFYLEADLLIDFDEMSSGEPFILIDEKKIGEENYSEIITPKGEIGLIKTSEMSLVEDTQKTNQVNVVRKTKEYSSINLIWDSISSYNDSKNYKMDSMDGLNVISPTWFSLNVNGIVINDASMAYTKLAHEAGYDVWGLYSNSFNPNWTNEMLNNEAYVNQSIAQMLIYSALYDLDGINIDFENIYLKDKAALVNYVEKVRLLTREQNLVLSIDAVVPGGSDQYSKVIDRERIAPLVDYFILMAYDEHWGSAPTSGSVASLPWVRKGVEGTLEFVPNEKLVLGVPLYMRIWVEVNNRIIDSKAYEMKNIDSYLEDIDYKIVYDEASEQNYIETQHEGNTIKIWLEDKDSMTKRIKLINEYDLAGIAGWRKGYEETYYWDLIDIYLKD